MSAPRVLIVYANPLTTTAPIPPIGAERVAHALGVAGCEVRLIAPWLGFAPRTVMRRALSWRPDLVGFSVRNVDDALVVRSRFGRRPLDTTPCLPAIRPLVAMAQAAGVPVLVGGAAVASMPRAVLHALGARWGVTGAADDLVWRLGRALAQGVPFPDALPPDPRVVDLEAPERSVHRGDADAWEPPPAAPPRMWEFMELSRVLGARMPVQVSVGCDRRCTFCVEPAFHGLRVAARPLDHILREIRALTRAGVTRIWLTASELNVPDGRHATAVLRAVAALGVDVDLQGFLQPAPVDDALLDALVGAGVDPTSLSFELGHLDEELLRRGAGPANLHHIERLVETWLRRGYGTLSGSLLLGAHPDETWESIDRALHRARALDSALPGGLSLAFATGGRVYGASRLGAWVGSRLAEARPHLYGTLSEGFVEPLVFCKPTSPRRLMGYVEDRLAGMRAPATPLNGESSPDPRVQRATKHARLGVLRLGKGKRHRAMRTFEAALRLVPRSPVALRLLGELLVDRGDASESARELLSRLRDISSDPLVHADVDALLSRLPPR